MYIPTANREDDPTVIKAFLRENSLCMLVTSSPKGLVATHLPVRLEANGKCFGTLQGHVARGNSQWRDFSPEIEALAVFTGPQHYISANWYPGKQVHGEEVPTWNYTAVHVYGRLRAIDDGQWLLEHVSSLTDQQETISPVPWKVSDAPPEYIAKISRAIVGLELEITRVEGKWKASQNRDGEDSAAVMSALEKVGTPESRAMRDLIQERRPVQKA